MGRGSSLGTRWIVLGRIVDEFEVAKEGRIDLGERHTYRAVKAARALVWVSPESKRPERDGDLDRAHAFAEAEGYTVFVYSGAEGNPLGRAKRELLRGAPATATAGRRALRGEALV